MKKRNFLLTMLLVLSANMAFPQADTYLKDMAVLTEKYAISGHLRFEMAFVMTDMEGSKELDRQKGSYYKAGNSTLLNISHITVFSDDQLCIVINNEDKEIFLDINKLKPPYVLSGKMMEELRGQFQSVKMKDEGEIRTYDMELKTSEHKRVVLSFNRTTQWITKLILYSRGEFRDYENDKEIIYKGTRMEIVYTNHSLYTDDKAKALTATFYVTKKEDRYTLSPNWKGYMLRDLRIR